MQKTTLHNQSGYILQIKIAYTIMPLGKRKWRVHEDKRVKSPNRVAAQSGILLFLLQRQSTR